MNEEEVFSERRVFMNFLKNARVIAFVAFAHLMIVSSVLFAQGDVYLQNEVLYNFESLDEWQEIKPETSSKFMVFGELTNRAGVVTQYPTMKIYETKPQGMSMLSAHSTNSLGVKVSFFRKSYNFFDLIPTEQKLIPGQVRTFEVWVWGGNYDYSMEVILSDYLERDHTLSLGSLRYIGWKNLSTPIPLNIVQAEAYVPRIKGLKFMHFRFWSSPRGGSDGFSVFLDYCKVVTDIFRTTYDGADLETELAIEAGGAESQQYSQEIQQSGVSRSTEAAAE